MHKRIAILGSTGSIGQNALKVISALGSDYKVVGLSAHNNIDLLIEQVHKYQPSYVTVTNPLLAGKLQSALDGSNVQIFAGPEGLVKLAEISEIDTVVTAVVGAAGLPAVLAAAKQGKTLAIANKEPLVIAGELLMQTARNSGAKILPVDSEHSAIFQSLQAGNIDEVNRIILTASGGPFRNASIEQIRNAKLEDALAHPTWNMGRKITVDSATMMNKALEIIEAHWLFNLPVDKIDVLIHPESIVHSMVEFIDGSVVAQMGTPDMCLPIQYALTYPNRRKGIANHLKLEHLGRLTFSKPDLLKFRALALGFEVAKIGGSAPVVFNAANEAAVDAFLNGRISFIEIVDLIESCLEKHEACSKLTLEELLEADAWARREVTECLKQTN